MCCKSYSDTTQSEREWNTVTTVWWVWQCFYTTLKRFLLHLFRFVIFIFLQKKSKLPKTAKCGKSKQQHTSCSTEKFTTRTLKHTHTPASKQLGIGSVSLAASAGLSPAATVSPIFTKFRVVERCGRVLIWTRVSIGY